MNLRFLGILVPFVVTACLRDSPRPAAPPDSSASGPSQDVASVPRPEVRAKSAPLPGFMKGINLGNGLDAPNEGEWGVTLRERHFEMAKAAGLDHVRLPVRFSGHAKLDKPFTIGSDFFSRVDWAVKQALSNGLSVIIDLHHYNELMKKPDENSDRLVGLWQQISAHYKDQPPQVAFEIINEPSDKFDADRVNAVTARAIAAIRVDNPTRIIIADPYFWASAEHLTEFKLPDDPNVVASFHMYAPILFTHQGSQWMTAEFQTRGVVFPGPPATKVEPTGVAQSTDWVRNWFVGYNSAPLATNPGGPKAVFDVFALVEDYILKTKKRVYLGEFGALDTADSKSRANYVRLVRQEAERHNIGWGYWDDGGGFLAMDVKSNSWVPFLKAALFD
jgi:endoglucanase